VEVKIQESKLHRERIKWGRFISKIVLFLLDKQKVHCFFFEK